MMFIMKEGKITAEFPHEELNILRGLIEEYRALLDDPEGDLRIRDRLFPKASLDDEEIDRKFAELTSSDLDEHKRAALDEVIVSLPPRGEMGSEIKGEVAEAWLILLTDLRLSLGTKMGVTQEIMETDFNFGEPENRNLLILHWLGGIQESLVTAIEASYE